MDDSVNPTRVENSTSQGDILSQISRIDSQLDVLGATRVVRSGLSYDIVCAVCAQLIRSDVRTQRAPLYNRDRIEAHLGLTGFVLTFDFTHIEGAHEIGRSPSGTIFPTGPVGPIRHSCPTFTTCRHPGQRLQLTGQQFHIASRFDRWR